jgi:hypothetical protein
MIVAPYSRTHQMSPQVRHCITELESLAITPKRLNELNDSYEMEDLVDNFVSKLQIVLQAKKTINGITGLEVSRYFLGSSLI